ncbi:MAG: zinc-binding dehydrogenase [Verrucomicrobiales bacterium]|nr:zinc-binding dehydrogenase [Verrucomicrobiales bacterium]
MKAFQLLSHGDPGTFALQDVPELAPGPGEAVVKVRACGLNHLDVWLEQGALPMPVTLPRTPGSEVAGEVLAVGDGGEAVRVGDRVVIQSNLFCGECEFCQVGEESQCLKGRLLGVDCDGGLAEVVKVPVGALVPLPAALDFEAGAALTLAASTAMHMLTNRTQVREGDWVLVIGAASGVGSAAIQIAKGHGARVLTTGTTLAKREFGLSLGAEFAVDPADPAWPSQVRRHTGKHGVDLVVEHVGGRVLEQVFACLARNGTVVTCGATAGRHPGFDLWPFFVKQQRLIGSYGRNREDLRRTLEWAEQGRLRPVIDTVFPLAEAAEAFARLRRGEMRGKLLVKP